ncbi:hypothetical protein AB4Z34_04880 [Ensifer sp. 2YAB10]|uniref:hypothetical protein n=1 Tax=Ensifer sp. 2YAB10 TaxID=3233021 RepID=UPI003F8E8500
MFIKRTGMLMPGQPKESDMFGNVSTAAFFGTRLLCRATEKKWLIRNLCRM